MLNFSIIPLNYVEHIEEICDDIAYQIKNGIATMPLFSAPLFPEGTPAFDKASEHCSVYRKFKKRLDKMGIPSGVLIQSSIGHGARPRAPISF